MSQDLMRNESFERWRKRLDKTPSGAPQHPAVAKLLSLYCTADEADFLSRLPPQFSSAHEIAELVGRPPHEIRRLLNALTDKFLIGDMDCGDGVHLYTPMVVIPGFWDFTFMRVRDELPMAELTRLWTEYWSTFYPSVLGYGSPTQDFRVMVQEAALPEKYTEVLDFERTSHIVQTARRISVALCSCSSMKQQRHVPICDRPIETCMSLNTGADTILRVGQGREISTAEAMAIIRKCQAHGMVQCADNVQQEPWYLCNCCHCCCGLFGAMRNYGIQHTVVSANFTVEVDPSRCAGCGTCAQVCPPRCTSVVGGQSRVSASACLGCGVCVTKCPHEARRLVPRPRRVYTPMEVNEKFLAMVLERGKLADQIFYDPSKLSHRFFSALVNGFLKLPVVKQATATELFKSRFLRAVARSVRKDFDKTLLRERARLAREAL